MKKSLIGLLAVALIGAGGYATAQTTRLSIGTGGTGGVYYPLGGGMAAILSKNVPGWQATAEVTGASVANLQLIGQGKQDIGFTMADTAWDAVSGLAKFKDNKVEARTLMVLYPNKMHVVTTESAGISKLIAGMMIFLTSESTILANAPPMTTPMDRSMTLPFNANCRNSVRRLCAAPREFAASLVPMGFIGFSSSWWVGLF